MRFFFDNTNSPRLVDAVRALHTDHELVHLRTKFDPGVADEIWIPELSRQGDWVIISGDVRITRNPAIRKIWQESGMVGFFLAKGWTNFDVWEQAWRFIRWWPRIVQQAESIRPPAGFVVPFNYGKMEQLRN